MRLVGEVDFGLPDMWAEWARFEAIVNLALDPYPLSSVCAYDDPILTAAWSTHPNVLTSAGQEENCGYRDPASVLRAIDPDGPDPLEATSPQLVGVLTVPAELAVLRGNLRTALTAAGTPGSVTEDFIAALSDICTNGLVHGLPPVSVRVWATGDRLLCTVTDYGDGYDDPMAGYLPPAGDDRYGTGLWMARHTVDRGESARMPDGFTVRLSTAVRDSAGERAARGAG